jgi:hypothetical protein
MRQRPWVLFSATSGTPSVGVAHELLRQRTYDRFTPVSRAYAREAHAEETIRPVSKKGHPASKSALVVDRRR